MSRIQIRRFDPLKVIIHQNDNEYVFIDEHDNVKEITRGDAIRIHWHLLTTKPLESIEYVEEFDRCKIEGSLKIQISPLLLQDHWEALVPKASLMPEYLEKLNNNS